MQLAGENFSRQEVVLVSMGPSHAIVQTKMDATLADFRLTSSGAGTILQPLSTWVWGSNSYGQLGGNSRAGTSSPTLLTPALFPRTANGNEMIEHSDGSYGFIKWDEGCMGDSCALQTNASLPGNVSLSWDMLEHHFNLAMGPGVLSISLDTGHKIQLKLKPGFQLDLVQGANIARMMGFKPVRIPARGVFKEVSSILSNNLLVYKFFTGKLIIEEASKSFNYHIFSANSGETVGYTIVIPIGSYTPA